MRVATAATAAAVAGLALVAAWAAALGPSGTERFVAGASDSSPVGAADWSVSSTADDRVPASVRASAARIRVAVVDTGADLSSPVFAAGRPQTFDVQTGGRSVTDSNGHGTFVASLVAEFGGSAKLMIVKAADAQGSMSAINEAAGIRYAVLHGAKIVNLSIAGTTTSPVERSAVSFAVKHGALVVAAVGNEYRTGNPVEYPAALLQPLGSDGSGGIGLAVGASDESGARAPFSNSGSWVSIAAPGVGVLGALSSLSSPTVWPRAATDAGVGLYGYGSGTSFAAPEVSGAAALVWAADPHLTAQQVAGILKRTASGGGTWTPDLGYGVIDVASAVAAATALR